ncbi:MAG: hypothetical protein PHH60_04190 [Candidatus Margulisbacteria bacterium]|nr:hypothetical protein [Candidatus Margulisiibacteriota bacterium]
MGEYEAYLSRLKGVKAELDGGRLYSRIEARIAGQSRRRKLVIEGMLAVMLIGFVLYFSIRPYLSSNGEAMADYVLQQETANGDPIMNYVFSN